MEADFSIADSAAQRHQQSHWVSKVLVDIACTKPLSAQEYIFALYSPRAFYSSFGLAQMS